MVARISYRYQIRGAVSVFFSPDSFQIIFFLMGTKVIFRTNIVGIIGYVLLLTIHMGSVHYFATFLCVSAVYIGPGLSLAWLNINTAPHYKRAAAIGIQQSMGNSAGIVVGEIYRSSPYILVPCSLSVHFAYRKSWLARWYSILRNRIVWSKGL